MKVYPLCFHCRPDRLSAGPYKLLRLPTRSRGLLRDVVEKAAIETAISSPFDIPEIGLYARVAPGGQTPGAMNLDMRIDAADVLLAREGELFTGQLAVSVAGYLPDGRA